MDFTEVIDGIFEIAPQVVVAAVFLVALFIVQRELRSYKTQMETDVDKAVNAHLGAIVGDINMKLANAGKTLDDMVKTQRSVEEQAASFESTITQRRGDIERILKDVEEKLRDVESKVSVLEQQTPSEEAVSPQKRAVLAQYASTPNEIMNHITAIRNDPDSTSKTLEYAGDLARKHIEKFRLALELYREACDRDADNDSARLEYLCLSAEVDQTHRNDYIQEAQDLVIARKNAPFLKRFFNTLITLRRYDDMAEVCETILRDNPNLPSDFTITARRNLAVALRNKDNIAEAMQELEKALEVAPDDENILVVYIDQLMSQKNYKRSYDLALQLVNLDPLDVRYYVRLSDICQGLDDHDSAISWLTKGEDLATTESDRLSIQKRLRQAKLRKDLREQFQSKQVTYKPRKPLESNESFG